MTISISNLDLNDKAPAAAAALSPSITVNGSSSAVVTPGAKITVAVANGPGNPTDWVAIYNAGDTNNLNHLSWVYLNGTQTAPAAGVKSATVTMTAPNTNGSYEVRFLANDTYTLLAKVTFSVQAASPPPPPPPPPPPSSPSITVNGSSSAVVTPGAKITVAVANGPGNPTDWVAIYNAGDTNNLNHLSWVYLNGTQTAPAAGVKSATVTMTAPNTNGSYEARFYANDAYTLLAKVTFSVQGAGIPVAITLSPANATIPDNASAGTVIATANVTMSDGSQFSGTLTTSDTNFFAISGHNIVTARAFTSADDGTHSTVITASQGGQSFSMEFSA